MADWRTCSAETTVATLTLGSDASCGYRPWGKGATFVDVVVFCRLESKKILVIRNCVPFS